VRIGKANPIQRRRWIEQKQTWLDQTCIERGVSNLSWTQCDATGSRAATSFTSVFALKNLPYA
jgi:hypothetical protein